MKYSVSSSVMEMRPFFLLAFMASCSVMAERDYNALDGSGGGDSAVLSQFKMYWKDAPNVIEDLDLFSALYIKYEGCVWSECGLGASYDDDGENRDGDEHWFQGRTQTFCANSAYSLYGVLANDATASWRKCSRQTYINSFFTLTGPEVIPRALGKTTGYGDDDGFTSSTCYEIEQESGDNNQNSHDSGDNNKNNGNGDGAVAATMGCSAEGSFVTATFSSDTCNGYDYVNTTDTLDDFNDAMESINCNQIWNRRKDSSNRQLEDGGGDGGGNDGGDNAAVTYGSAAEAILYNSAACSLQLYPYHCPDPYGIKKAYMSSSSTFFTRSSSFSRRSVGSRASVQTPIRILSWINGICGVILCLGAYLVSRKRKIIKEGGGGEGILRAISADVANALQRDDSASHGGGGGSATTPGGAADGDAKNKKTKKKFFNSKVMPLAESSKRRRSRDIVKPPSMVTPLDKMIQESDIHALSSRSSYGSRSATKTSRLREVVSSDNESEPPESYKPPFMSKAVTTMNPAPELNAAAPELNAAAPELNAAAPELNVSPTDEMFADDPDIKTSEIV